MDKKKLFRTDHDQDKTQFATSESKKRGSANSNQNGSANKDD